MGRRKEITLVVCKFSDLVRFSHTQTGHPWLLERQRSAAHFPHGVFSAEYGVHALVFSLVHCDIEEEIGDEDLPSKSSRNKRLREYTQEEFIQKQKCTNSISDSH